MITKFEIPGEPVAKGRPRFARVGKFVRTYTPANTLNFEKCVAWYAMKAGIKPIVGPVEMIIKFYFCLPKSKYRKRKPVEEHPKLTKPDLDNCIKSVKDSLNKIAYADDAQVWKITAEKYYCGQNEIPRTEIILISTDTK